MKQISRLPWEGWVEARGFRSDLIEQLLEECDAALRLPQMQEWVTHRRYHVQSFSV